MKASGVWTALLALIGLAACGRLSLSPEHDAALRDVFVHVRDGRLDEVASALPPGADTANTLNVLNTLHQIIPQSAPQSVRIVQWRESAGPDGQRFDALYAYRYSSETLMVRTAIVRPAAQTGGDVVQAFQINVLSPAQAARLDTFSLEGLSPLAYGVIVGAILSPLVILAALIDLVRAKAVKRKWLWALGVVWGYGGAGVNLANGTSAILFGVTLFGASAVNLGDSWRIEAAFPLFAVLFLCRDRQPRTRSHKRRGTLNLDSTS